MRGPQEPRGRSLIVLVCVTIAARLCSVVRLHPINWDEIEFYRACDWIRQGLVPYRDFWEHHTPLQWFLFAPLTALISSSGANAIVAMRVAQIALWIAIFALIALWMRDGAVGTWSRRASIVFALSSSLLMLSAVEFRVDVLGILLFLLGVIAVDRSDRGRHYAFAAGVFLCLAGFANLRLGPLLALTVLLARIIRPRERRWEGNSRINWTWAGVIATFAGASLYFVVTNSWRIAFQRLWIENFLGDRRAEDVPWQFVDRLVSPFGIRLDTPGLVRFEAVTIDVATIVLLLVGGFGVVRTLRAGRRTPDRWFFLAFLQLSNFLFIGALKYVYLYHLQLLLVLMVPFVAREIERVAASSARRRYALLAFLSLAAFLSSAAAIFRGSEGDFDYQDAVMRGADHYTAPGSKVFDGVGWALRRRPAYEYWFLPALARVHERDGVYRPYLIADMAGDPPAAVITDYRTRWWLQMHPRLSEFVVRHYLPAWRDLWLPGLSGVVSRGSSQAQWIAPVDGDYRIYASAGLAYHPWFRDSGKYGMGAGRDSGKLQVDLRRFGPAPSGLTWMIDGRPVSPVNGALKLRRKQVLSAWSTNPVPIAIFVVPAYQTTLFRQPPAGVTLDGANGPRTHIPDFGQLGHALLFWRQP